MLDHAMGSRSGLLVLIAAGAVFADVETVCGRRAGRGHGRTARGRQWRAHRRHRLTERRASHRPHSARGVRRTSAGWRRGAQRARCGAPGARRRDTNLHARADGPSSPRRLRPVRHGSLPGASCRQRQLPPRGVGHCAPGADGQRRTRPKCSIRPRVAAGPRAPRRCGRARRSRTCRSFAMTMCMRRTCRGRSI